MLIEVAHTDEGGTPEVSYGTHFFQDLVEANIHPLPLYPDDPNIIYREEFFQAAPNCLSQIMPADERFTPYIKVIDVPAISDGRTLALVMDGEKEEAVAYLTDETPCLPGLS